MRPQYHLVLAWLWVLLGIVSGALLGAGFEKAGWLGGYQAWRRRMYRLGHIALFGMAILNLLFYFTVQLEHLAGPAVDVASWCFLVGAVTMPVCCGIMAHKPRLKALFALPVLALAAAAALTAWEVLAR